MKEKKPQRNFEDEIREGNAPGFSVPLTMKRAKLGDTVILECVPYGKPFPEIKWLKDGIEIEVNNKIEVKLYLLFILNHFTLEGKQFEQVIWNFLTLFL